MARLRYNGLTATLGADLLTAGTTITFTSALTHAAGAVPTITGTDYIPLSILADDGTVLEIMHLTAYTTGATTGTVLRAQESTTATDHGSGLRVVHGLTVADMDTAGGVSATHIGVTGAGCAAYCSTAQSIPNTTSTIITLDAETFDTHGFHDPSVNPSRLTIPAGLAGTYLVDALVAYQYNTAGSNRSVSLYKNGVGQAGFAVSPVVSQSAPQVKIMALAAGDYLELSTWQDSGAARLLDPGKSSLSIYRLGD